MAIRKQATVSADVLLAGILEGVREKKGHDIAIMDLRALPNVIADYFIICSGNTERQTTAIAESILEIVKKKLGETPAHKEGLRVGEWVLLDYLNIIVHIFIPRVRNFYNLEELWGDAEFTRYDD